MAHPLSIQAGAILAVVLIYRERLWQLLVDFGRKSNRDYALKLALAFSAWRWRSPRPPRPRSRPA
mgnify:CR=1 FL=1